MSVRAKMTCSHKSTESHGVVVKFRAVTDDSVENKTWSKYTPSGEVELVITNEAAYDQFEQGKDYFVDFEPVG